MTQVATHSDAELQDAIFELVSAERFPDAHLIEGVVNRYPEFAEEITEVAIELAMDMLANPEKEIKVQAELEEVSPAVARAISNFENELFERRKEESVDAPKTNTIDPFSTMNRNSFRDFSASIRANTLFSIKIRDRQIKSSTIPLRYLEMIAESLSVSLDQFRDYLNHRNGRLALGNQFFKADDKPDHDIQVSFDEAVLDSGLTAAQQEFLLSLK